MGFGINTNIPSINNQNTLNKLQSPIQSSLEKLSTGSRINSAKDDAAGLAIVQQFANQILGANQGQKNMSDGISMMQVAEGYASEIESQTQRARELAIQSGNGTLSDSDRAALQTEYQQIQDDVKRMTDSAEFNGQKLFNQAQEISLQTDGETNSSINLRTHDLQSQLDGFLSSDISTQSGSQASLSVLDDASKSINSARADFGAMNNRLESMISNQSNMTANLEQSRSRIADTDYAQQTSELTKDLILNDFATSMQGHANMSQKHVMSLLGS